MSPQAAGPTLPPPQVQVDRRADDPLALLRRHLATTGTRTLICAESAGRRETMHQYFVEHGLPIATRDHPATLLAGSEKVVLASVPLMHGFAWPDAELAVLTEDPDLTAFRQRQAQMYAGYHASVEPVTAFVPIGQFAAARTASGKVVFVLPLDYLLWTQGFAAAASSITNEVSLMKGVKDRELWVGGTLSPRAKESLGKMGWKVSEEADVLLKGALL